MQTLSVMTYNIKCDWPGNREHTWADRKDAVIGRILAVFPDVLAMREAFAHQWRDLVDALPGHQLIAVGRDDGAEGREATALFIDSAGLDVRSTDTLWISPTPRKPGSLWPGAG